MNVFPVISIEEVEDELKTFDFKNFTTNEPVNEKDSIKEMFSVRLSEQLEQEKNKLRQEINEVIKKCSENNSNIALEDNFFELAIICIEKKTGRKISIILGS